MLTYGTDQVELEDGMLWRIQRQQLRDVTGYELPVIDRLSYRDVVDIIQYENELRERRNRK